MSLTSMICITIRAPVNAWATDAIGPTAATLALALTLGIFTFGCNESGAVEFSEGWQADKIVEA